MNSDYQSNFLTIILFCLQTASRPNLALFKALLRGSSNITINTSQPLLFRFSVIGRKRACKQIRIRQICTKLLMFWCEVHFGFLRSSNPKSCQRQKLSTASHMCQSPVFSCRSPFFSLDSGASKPSVLLSCFHLTWAMIFIMPISVLLVHILVLFFTRHSYRETSVRCRDNSCLCGGGMRLCHQRLFRGHSPPILVRRIPRAITVTDSCLLSTPVLA